MRDHIRILRSPKDAISSSSAVASTVLFYIILELFSEASISEWLCETGEPLVWNVLAVTIKILVRRTESFQSPLCMTFVKRSPFVSVMRCVTTGSPERRTRELQRDTRSKSGQSSRTYKIINYTIYHTLTQPHNVAQTTGKDMKSQLHYSYEYRVTEVPTRDPLDAVPLDVCRMFSAASGLSTFQSSFIIARTFVRVALTPLPS